MRELLPMFTASGETRVQLHVSGDARPIGAVLESHLLRIAQEAASNALRHAAPRTIQISLVYAPGSVTLEIRDDGCGFDPSAAAPLGHFGLRGIRERVDKMQAGLTIESARETGTVIRVVVPQNHEK